MRNLVFLFVAIFFFQPVIAQTTLTALDYNDKIVDEQSAIAEKIAAFNNTMNTTKANSITALNDLIVTIDKGIAALTKLGGYKGDVDFQLKALDLFKFYKRCASTAYFQIVDIVYTKSMTDEDLTKLKKLSTEVGAEEKIYDDAFLESQVKFAKKYGFTLGENKTSN